MIKKTIISALCIIAVLTLCDALMAEPFRGIELKSDAEDSILDKFDGAGINAIIIPFPKQGNLEDRNFRRDLKRWSAIAGKRNMRCFYAIRLFGPPDYTGAKKGYPGCVEAISNGGPCVCPTHPEYWSGVVAPRVKRAAELAKENGLSGVMFQYEATLSGLVYHQMFCYCGYCWGEFVKTKCGGDAKLLAYGPRDRLSWLRSSGRAHEYYACLAGMVEARMREAAEAARIAAPDIEFGVFDYWDTWFYDGVIRGLSRDGASVPAILTEYERYSIGRLSPVLARRWEKNKLAIGPVARLPLNYYTPRDVRNQIAELDREKTGFLLAATDSLWRQVEDYFHIHPACGSAESFALAVRDGMAGSAGGKGALNNRQHQLQFIPRMGVLHGSGISDVVSSALVQMAEAFQLPSTRLDATKPDDWAGNLSLFEMVMELPGAGKSGGEGLEKRATDIERFLKRGGLLFVLNASDAAQTAWLSKLGRQYAVKGEMKAGLAQAWLDDKTGVMTEPVNVESFPPLMWHFTAAAEGYIPLAKDNKGAPYLLYRPVGRGHLYLAAGPVIPLEVVLNAWFQNVRRGDLFTAKLMTDGDLAFGKNRLTVGVAEYPETASPVDLRIDAVNSRGGTTAFQFNNASLSGDGMRLPVDFEIADEGAGTVVVTISDPEDGALIRRYTMPVIHDQRVIAVPNKNYYTDEKEAVIELKYVDKSLLDATVKCRMTGGETKFGAPQDGKMTIRFPLSQVFCGEYEVYIDFTRGNEDVYTIALPIRKEEPFPTAVKMLYGRSCVLEMGGKPFFPFGCYGINAAQEEELAALGVNINVGAGGSSDRKLKGMDHTLRHWADSAEWTPQKVREELKKPEYAQIAAWYMFDEPELNSQSSDLLFDTYTKGREKDPYHPQASVYVGSMSYPVYPDYMTSGECQMMDDYPLPYFGPARYGDMMQKLADACRGRRCAWGVPQCFDWREIGGAIGPYKKVNLHPGGEQALNYIYQSVAHGAGAMTFWTYGYVAGDERRNAGFKKALAEGAKVVRLVEQGEVVQSPRFSPLCADIRMRSFKIDGKVYVVAVNRTTRNLKIRFDDPMISGRKLTQYLPEEKALEGIEDVFGPLQGKVYVIADK